MPSELRPQNASLTWSPDYGDCNLDVQPAPRPAAYARPWMPLSAHQRQLGHTANSIADSLWRSYVQPQTSRDAPSTHPYYSSGAYVVTPSPPNFSHTGRRGPSRQPRPASEGSLPMSERLDSRRGVVTTESVPTVESITLIHNAANTLSLRKYLHWIVSWNQVHKFQSIHHTKTTDTESISSPTVIVIRNLYVLEDMYRPGRVIVPSKYVEQAVACIHATLTCIKEELETRCDQMHEQASSLHAAEFVKWVTERYKVCGQPFDHQGRGLRRNPDSVRDQRTVLQRPIIYYSTSDVLYDRTATNTLVDLILSTLKMYLSYLRPAKAGRESEFKMLMRAIKRRHEAPAKMVSPQRPKTSYTPAKSPTDQLFCCHPAPF